MADSASGYVGCVPLRSKGQLELMTREVLSFTAGLGHAEVIFRCDNEPTMRQLLKYVVSTRLSMGLATRSVTPPAYSHGNSLVGKRKFWEEQFLPKLKEQFSVSASVLEGEGSSISFLKRKLVRVDHGWFQEPTLTSWWKTLKVILVKCVYSM